MSSVDAHIEVVAEIEALLPRYTRTIESFFDDAHGYGAFQLVDRPSPVSHAMSVEALDQLPRSREDRRAAWPADRHVERLIVATTSRSEEFQAYDLSFVLPALRLFGQSAIEANKTAIERAVALAIERFHHWASEVSSASGVSGDPARRSPKAHAMFLYRIRRAIWSTIHQLGPTGVVLPDMVDELNVLASTYDRLILDHFYYLVSMCNAVPENDEDALQLGYSLYALRRYSDAIVNDIISEHAIALVARSLVSDSHPSRLHNIIRSGDVTISASPIHLLAILAKLDLVQRRFDAVSPLYEVTYDWLKRTTRYGIIGDFHDGTPAWMQEPWRGVGEPEAWINASVVDFLKNYAELLRSVVADELKVEFGASVARPSIQWRDVVDYADVKSELRRAIIDPIVKRQAGSRTELDTCSAILFGPPGTAKTTLAKALAWEIAWPFVEFKPHHFAMDGEDGVVRSIATIFRRLLLMRECVVFFDEIDELVSTRDDKGQTTSGRLITTSVLPWLQELRDRGQVVFIVATNNVGRFDPAVKRPGRFDLVLPVGPPDEKSRERLLEIFVRKALDWANDAEVKEIVASYRSTDLERDHGDSVTLGELRQIAQAVKRSDATSVHAAEEVVRAMCTELVGHLLITTKALEKFEQDQAKYRFPPLVSPAVS